MQLFTVRTVIVNEVNDITVCEDRTSESGAFYTVISIKKPEIKKEVAHILATTGLFATNVDYQGSYVSEDRLNLVFSYRAENRLAVQEIILCTNDAKRLITAENLLIAAAETQVTGSIGLLLFHERNINITANLDIFFNYFIDFSSWNPSASDNDFYKAVATRVFTLLSVEYEAKYSGAVHRYPSELQVLYRKARSGGYTSFSGIIAFVKMLSGGYSEPAIGWRYLWSRIKQLIAFVRANWTTVMAVALIIVTLIFLIYQIYARVRASAQMEENFVYIGLEQIGDVFLGDEDL